jgi:hypothetical protein
MKRRRNIEFVSIDVLDHASTFDWRKGRRWRRRGIVNRINWWVRWDRCENLRDVSTRRGRSGSGRKNNRCADLWLL